ncbi:MAG TPA: PTS sugar transporter subunit IIA [bacterium]|nr:PTS sugar transporter subunit IIA [bacterium]
MSTGAIGIIVATHGSLAEALVGATELIVGHKIAVRPFAFGPGEEPKGSSERLQALIKRCDKGRGVIILVDMFGGTPGSLALSHLREQAVEVLTGVNLPMVMAAAGLPQELDLAAASRHIAVTGQNSIKQAGQMLQG